VNEDFIPQVRKYGSIGASGDLVPLATVAGSITGIFPSTAVLLNNETMTSEQALNKLGLKKIHLNPKEGLALINGTSMMAGIAAIIMERTNALIKLSLSIQAIMIQSLKGTSEYFHEDLHQHKPHRGQAWVAKIMSALLEGSLSITATTLLRNSKIPDDLIQDRYSIRCLPQFLGPIIEGLNDIQQQIDVEINSTTDNPLVDAEKKKFYHGGHFLGQYLSMGMDRLRHMLALSAKHLDTQIALLMTPEFSHGLPPSLSCDSSGLGVGCKALQIGGNSIVPLLEHRGMPLADRFPTYAEQFNQNVNSQGMGACLLADESLDLYRRYLVITLIISTQAIDLRAQEMQKGPQGAAILSEKTQPLHRSVRQLLLGNPDEDRPLIRSNKDQSFASWIQAITEDLNDHNGLILSSLPGFDPEYLA
jgi:phenylalanine ammonia-lyase